MWLVGDAAAEPTPVTTSIPASEAFISVAKAAQPAVVNISSSRKVVAGTQQPPSPFFDDPFFRRFFGEEFRRRLQLHPERREQGLGSGVLVSPDGYIVTTNHVIAEAEEVTVLLADSRRFTAKVVATDPRTDVAVIKIRCEGTADASPGKFQPAPSRKVNATARSIDSNASGSAEMGCGLIAG